jgi:hypothetical protein
MSFSNDLIVIFNQGTKDHLEGNYGVPQGPLLTYVLGSWFKGSNITLTLFAKKYKALFGIEMSQLNDFYGPFNSEEELKKFTYLLSEEIEAKEVNLIPLDSFSKAIQESGSMEELRNQVKASSDVIENMEIEPQSSSLLQKLLSKSR